MCGSVITPFCVLCAVNTIPVVNVPIPAQQAVPYVFFSYTIPAESFTDPDVGDSLYCVTNIPRTAVYPDGTVTPYLATLPSWLSFNPANKTYYGTPAYTDVEVVNINLTCADHFGATVQTFWKLQIWGATTDCCVGVAVDVSLVCCDSARMLCDMAQACPSRPDIHVRRVVLLLVCASGFPALIIVLHFLVVTAGIQPGTQFQYSFQFELAFARDVQFEAGTLYACNPFPIGTHPTYTPVFNDAPTPDITPVGNIYVKGSIPSDGKLLNCSTSICFTGVCLELL